MSFECVLKKAHETDNFLPVIEAIPYAKLLGMRLQRFGSDVIFSLPDNSDNIGSPILPAVHGGVIGGFMEMSAALHLMMFLDAPSMPKIIDFSLDYLRAARGGRDTFAECQVVRQGSRVANVIINAWQTRREDAVAIARAHFLLEPQFLCFSYSKGQLSNCKTTAAMQSDGRPKHGQPTLGALPPLKSKIQPIDQGYWYWQVSGRACLPSAIIIQKEKL